MPMKLSMNGMMVSGQWVHGNCWNIGAVSLADCADIMARTAATSSHIGTSSARFRFNVFTGEKDFWLRSPMAFSAA
ncbi:MAG: hypothetical protein ACD_39C02042G0001 [uncultured bacterium]|nr:MAG: hypothetical protein ACD_39C02042G0001 [uncultured bacterium]